MKTKNRGQVSRRSAKSNAKGSGPCFRARISSEFHSFSPKNGPDPGRCSSRAQVTLDSSSALVVNYSGSSAAAAISLLQPTSTTAYDSQENPLSQTDAMGTISASTFDNLGRPLAASQGQAVNVASGGPATFANLSLAPGLARTYTLYAQSSTAPSGYSVTQSGAGAISWTTNVVATTPLGGAAGGWYELGVVTLAQGNTSTGLTVSYSDDGTVSQVAYLEQTSATVYDAASNVLSQVDGLNNVTTFGYNNVEQQISTSQGQIVPVTFLQAASFNNLPQTPGVARTYTLYVQASSFNGSYTVTDNFNGSPLWTAAPSGATTPLGSGWSAAGTVTLAAGDVSSTLSFPNLGSATEICLVEQVSGTTYTKTGLVGTQTNGDGGLTTFGYNAVGEEISKTDPAGQAGRPVTTYVDDALGRVTSIFSPLPAGEGQGEGGEGGSSITAYSYAFGQMYNSQTETYFPGDSVTTSQGQAVPVSSNSAPFQNLGLLQSEAAEQRVYTVYVQAGTAPTNESAYSVSENGGGTPNFAPWVGTAPAAAFLGAGWYELGTVTLGNDALHIADLSSAVTVACPSSAGVSQVALLQQTAVDTCDADGDLVSEVDAAGSTTSYVYNTLGLPAQQADPSNVGIELGAVYDKVGNVLTDTDLMGNATSYQHNDLGQTVVTTQPETLDSRHNVVTHVTIDSFDADGDLLSETDPLGNVTSYSYDPFGDEVRQSLPNPTTGAAGGPTTASTYDLDGDLLTQTDALGNVTAYSYDPFGNEVSQSLPDPANGAQDAKSPTTSFTYDAVGDVLSLTDPDGNTTAWSYDGLGNETSQSETVALGYNSSHVVQYTTASSSNQYDLAGDLVQATDADGRVIDYGYNAAKQEVSQQWYAAGGAAAGSAAYSYDTAGHMLGASDRTASGSLIAGYTNQYDSVGNLAAQAITIGGLNVAGPVSDVVLTSTYDFNGDRLSLAATLGGDIASGSVVNGTPDFINNYAYDAGRHDGRDPAGSDSPRAGSDGGERGRAPECGAELRR